MATVLARNVVVQPSNPFPVSNPRMTTNPEPIPTRQDSRVTLLDLMPSPATPDALYETSAPDGVAAVAETGAGSVSTGGCVSTTVRIPSTSETL